MVDVMNMEQISYHNTETLVISDTVSLITKNLLRYIHKQLTIIDTNHEQSSLTR